MLKSIACFSGALSIAMLAAGSVSAQAVPSPQSVINEIFKDLGGIPGFNAAVPAPIAPAAIVTSTSSNSSATSKFINGIGTTTSSASTKNFDANGTEVKTPSAATIAEPTISLPADLFATPVLP